MAARTIDDLIAGFVGTLAVLPATRRQYEKEIRLYLQWAAESKIDPLAPTAGDAHRYSIEMQKRLTPQSAVHRVSTVRRFYGWLIEKGHISEDPWADVARLPWVRERRRGLTLDQARQLMATAAAPREKALLGLFLINGLRAVEVYEARVRDVGLVDGHPVLKLPKRSRAHALPYTVLPPLVSEPVMQVIDARTSGNLILNQWDRPLDGRAAAVMLRNLGKSAGINAHLTPTVLATTMREIALSEGFSFASLMRAVPEIEMRDLTARTVRLDLPLSQHAAFRVARVLTEDFASNESLLAQAERLLHEPDIHPAASIALAAAALERHLRQLCEQKDLRANPKLTGYSSSLRQHRILSEKDVQLIAGVAEDRDNACHGQFDLSTDDIAQHVIGQATLIITKHPLHE